MTNDDIYKYCLSLLRKSTKGNALPPNDFTRYLQQANSEFLNQEYAKFEATQRIGDSFRPLKTNGNLSVTAGAASFPSTPGLEYLHIIPTLYYGDIRVDFLTVEEYLNLKDDELTAPSAAYPVAYIDNSTQIKFDGITSGNVTMRYIRKPDTPYYDYYIDANYEVKYLTEGQAAYTLGTDEVYRDGSTSGAKTSISKELDWEDSDKTKIANMILGYLGVQLEDQAVFQHSNIKEQKDAMLP